MDTDGHDRNHKDSFTPHHGGTPKAFRPMIVAVVILSALAVLLTLVWQNRVPVESTAQSTVAPADTVRG
ncbi:hypothetical protein HT136_19800 [Novosphingobium profundi]|uniref:hypothetical protein n=1 Tax=Novosphingobium profundi TaxID=1774954 RepID=UPI001BD969B9|nr:hypothetical protein [Novosphingobium profundi]MBT0670616.1 hypothetical protein [Novosphingobium profundi]